MRIDLGILLASVSTLNGGVALAQTATPPIFNPGAPGQPSRVISVDEAHELSRTTFTPADVAFMQHMIVHHAQAVEMVDLLQARGSNARVKLLGRRIALSQEAEMEIMRGWLAERDQPLEMPGMDHSVHGGMDHSAHVGHSGHDPHTGHGADDPEDTPVMAGMLTPRQMRTLAEARGPEFDRLFLAGMIQHHQGALDMVADLMETPNPAQDTVLSEFTASVVADQQAEILRMQSLLSEP